jgi:hypothetical protein
VSYAAEATDPGPPESTSKVPDDGYRWRFGDGLPGGLSATPTHVFRRAGVHCGLATARDRAGNVGRAAFVSRIGPAGRRPVLGRARILGRTTDRRAVRAEVCHGARTALRVAVTDRAGVHHARTVRGPGLVELRLRARPGRVALVFSAGRERRVVS